MNIFEIKCPSCGGFILGPREGGKARGRWLGHDLCGKCKESAATTTAEADELAEAADIIEDLLAALEGLEYQLGGETDPVKKRFADARTKARKAIAKARCHG